MTFGATLLFLLCVVPLNITVGQHATANLTLSIK